MWLLVFQHTLHWQLHDTGDTDGCNIHDNHVIISIMKNNIPTILTQWYHGLVVLKIVPSIMNCMCVPVWYYHVGGHSAFCELAEDSKLHKAHAIIKTIRTVTIYKLNQVWLALGSHTLYLPVTRSTLDVV